MLNYDKPNQFRLIYFSLLRSNLQHFVPNTASFNYSSRFDTERHAIFLLSFCYVYPSPRFFILRSKLSRIYVLNTSANAAVVVDASLSIQQVYKDFFSSFINDLIFVKRKRKGIFLSVVSEDACLTPPNGRNQFPTVILSTVLFLLNGSLQFSIITLHLNFARDLPLNGVARSSRFDK